MKMKLDSYTRRWILCGALGLAVGCTNVEVPRTAADDPGMGVVHQPDTTSGYSLLPGNMTRTDATGTTSNPNPDGSVSWCCTSWTVGLPTTAPIFGLTVAVQDNGSANGHPIDGNNVIVVLLSGSTVIGSVSSNGSGNPQALTITLTSGHSEPLTVRYTALAGGALPGPATNQSVVGMMNVTTSTTTTTTSSKPRTISSLLAQPQFPAQPCAIRQNGTWTFQPSGAGDDMLYPVPVLPGDTILSWKVYITKGSDSSNNMVADLKVHDSLTDTFSTIGSDITTSADAPGNTSLGAQASVSVIDGKTYWITVNSDNGSVLDTTHDAEITVQ